MMRVFAGGRGVIGRNSSATLYYVFPVLLLFVVLFEGWWFDGDNGKLFSNFFAISFVLISLLKITFSAYYLVIIFACAFVVSASLLFNLQADQLDVYRDLLLFFKVAVFPYAVYSFYHNSSVRGDLVWLQRISLLIWGIITVSIGASYLFGLGLSTYDEFSAGSKFYFPSVNELNFVYFVSMFMVVYFTKSLSLRLVCFVLSFLVYLAVGNKSFLALYFIAGFGLFFLYFSLIWRAAIVSAFIIFFVFLALFPSVLLALFGLAFNFLYFIFGVLSGGGEKFMAKASYLSPFSALISERDVLYLIGHNIYFNDLDVGRLLFGLSYGLYGSLYAEKRGGGDFSFSEIDPVDLFFSYGISGLGLFIVFFFIILFGGASSYAKPRKVLVLIFVLAGLMTGHVYGYIFPLFFFSMYFGLLASRSKA